MRHGSVVCTVTVYTPSGVPPLLLHIQVPIALFMHDKKSFRHRLLLEQGLKLCFPTGKALAAQNMGKV